VFYDAFDDGAQLFESFEIDDESLDGSGRRIVTAFQPTRGSILSGELRLERELSASDVEGVVFASMRGRRERTHAGGAAEAELDEDPVSITFRSIEEPPDFVFEPGNREAVDQQLLGIGARLSWRETIELNLGLQHSWYRQRVREDDGGPTVGGDDRRMLGNIGVAYRPAEGVRLYAGYVRGLEELDAAPFTAVNANVALAAATATQTDFAVEWKPNETLTLIVSAFELSRPFADVDDEDVFGIRGEERNRGVELSAVWRPNEGVNVVLGVVRQEPRLHGPEFERGAHAPALPELRMLLEADVAAPFWEGLFFTVSAAHERGIRTNAENLHELPSQTTLDLGLRYEFEVGETPMQLEVNVENVTDEFFWIADGSDGFTLNEPRLVSVSLTADF
jgi:iron complex outermembrane receptor protein